ncbi:hypothetical protein, partial [Burkholderia cenocepacia]|uniref:hypothetical protein n=1 Tax=Burkholderia cenocepacia TaxID=95486 RepID=UPI001B9358E3
IVFGTLHFGGSPVGELVLETRFSRIPREPPPSTFNYARDIARSPGMSASRRPNTENGRRPSLRDAERATLTASAK